MKVLLTGANGFVGYYLSDALLRANVELIATGRHPDPHDFAGRPGYRYQLLDFTDPFAVHDFFEKEKPDAVIHAGAMSKPDDCEAKQWEAYTTNTEGTLTLLMNAEEHKSFFIFLSTDFVFSGEKGMYREDDERAPVNFYGKTKMEAEDAVFEYPYDAAIVRTVLVYGFPRGGRGNLLTVVARKLTDGETYSVFNDQVRSPTYVEDLASGIVTILTGRHTGLFHLSGEDVLTPYEMAMKTASYLGLDGTLIKKITEADMKQPARRPLKTGFDISRAKNVLGYKPVSFEEGMKKTFG